MLSLRLSGVVDNPPGEGVLVGAEVYPHFDDRTLFEGEAVSVALHVDILKSETSGIYGELQHFLVSVGVDSLCAGGWT